VIDDFVEGFEDAVRQPVRPHELPDIFLRVELRRTQRQEWSRGRGWEVGGVTVYVASVPPLALLGRAARCWCPGCARAAAGSYAFTGRLVGLSALKTNAAAAPPSSSART